MKPDGCIQALYVCTCVCVCLHVCVLGVGLQCLGSCWRLTTALRGVGIGVAG